MVFRLNPKKFSELDPAPGLDGTELIPIVKGGENEITTTQAVADIAGGGAVDSVNGQTGVVELDTSDISDTTNKRYVTDSEKTKLANTSGINTGDQDLSAIESAINNRVSKGELVINIKDYGAVGNGTTDDTAAIQAASNACTAAGGGVVFFPAGHYMVYATPVKPTSNVTYLGVGDGSVLEQKGTQNNFFFWNDAAPASVSNITFERLTFIGPVNQTVTVPTRARTIAYDGTYIAIYLRGNLIPGEAAGTITNVTVINCNFRNTIHTPIYIGGVSGKVITTGCEFNNCRDVGYIFNQEVICNYNHAVDSADNGFSISRGNQKITCVGNTAENCCYNGIWLSGFGGQNGPSMFTCIGNSIKNCGQNGIVLQDAPIYGTISGNVIDKNYVQGPSDQKSDAMNSGIYIRGNSGNINDTVRIAVGLNVTGNTIRNCPEAGIMVIGAKIFNVSGNIIIDTGTQYKTNGTTLVGATDTTLNNGICILGTSVASGNIANNYIIDSRVTPYMNYGVTPDVYTGIQMFNNSVSGARSQTSQTSQMQGPVQVGVYAGPSTGINFQSTTNTVNTGRFINTGSAGASGGGGIIAIADPSTAAVNNDRLAFFLGGGATDANHSLIASGGMVVSATETWGTGRGTKLAFQVTQNTQGGRTTALTLDQDLSATFAGKANIPNIKLGTSSSVGQVWTASDTAGNGSWQNAVSGGVLTPTSVKTSNYSATANDLVPVDLTSGSVTVTLPSAPADKTQIAVKLITPMSGNTLTVKASGTDSFNDTNRGQYLLMTDQPQTVLVQYNASTGIWYELSLPQRPKAFMPRAQAALANGHRKPSSFFAVGSSSTAGSGADSPDHRWTDVLGTLIHTTFNSPGVWGGRHIPATDAGVWTTAGTIVTVSGGFSLQSKQMSPGATYSITLSNCTGINVHFMQGPSATGTATVSIDGTVVTTITPDTTGSDRFDGLYTSSNLTRGTHTFLLTAVGTFTFEAIYARDNDTTSVGARMYTSGKSGATSADFLADATVMQRAGTLTNVAGIFIELGPNDWSGNMAPATFESNMRSLITAYQSGLTSSVPDICLIINHRRLDLSSPTYDWDDYAQRMYNLAASMTGVYVIDMRPYFPTVNDATHDPQDVLGADNVHPTTAGHALEARVILAAIAQNMITPQLRDTTGTLTAGTLTLSGGIDTSANGIAVYNTSDRLTNYERVKFEFNANVAQMLVGSAGTGVSNRDFLLGTPNRQMRFVDTGNSSGGYRFGSGSGQGGAVGMIINGSYTPSSGINTILSVSPTISQSGTAGYTAILVNPTESATGSGAKMLLDLQVGGSSKFSVNNAGYTIGSELEIGGNGMHGGNTGTLIRWSGGTLNDGAVILLGGSTNGTLPSTGVGRVGTNEIWRWDTNGITLADTKNIIFSSTTGTKIGTATNQKIGFYNATPVVQQNTTGTITGFTANTSVNNIFNESTFTGNTGSTAYTISDIVKALKTLGLIAS